MRALNHAACLLLFGCITSAPTLDLEGVEPVRVTPACCEDATCRLPPGESCVCKVCSDSSACHSAACRALAPSIGYCLEVPAASPACADPVRHLRVDVQSVCTVNASPSGCVRRLELHADAGVTAQVVIDTPGGPLKSVPVAVDIPDDRRADLAALLGVVACDRPAQGEACLTRQPFIVLHRVLDDGGTRELFSFDLGATGRPSRAVMEGLWLLQETSMPVWRDAGLGYLP